MSDHASWCDAMSVLTVLNFDLILPNVVNLRIQSPRKYPVLAAVDPACTFTVVYTPLSHTSISIHFNAPVTTLVLHKPEERRKKSMNRIGRNLPPFSSKKAPSLLGDFGLLHRRVDQVTSSRKMLSGNTRPCSSMVPHRPMKSHICLHLDWPALSLIFQKPLVLRSIRRKVSRESICSAWIEHRCDSANAAQTVKCNRFMLWEYSSSSASWDTRKTLPGILEHGRSDLAASFECFAVLALKIVLTLQHWKVRNIY